MHELLTTEVGRWRVRVVATDRSDGDMHPERVAPDLLAARQLAVTGTVWPMLEQVHGTDVVSFPSLVDAPVGDIAVSRSGGSPVAVWAADCAPVALVGRRGTIAMVHAGWRGLAGGVLDVAVRAANDADGGVAAAVLGPTIGPCCYEFSAADTVVVAAGVGAAADEITGVTAWGTPALDVPAAVGVALARHGLAVAASCPCTGCDERWFSHRRRAEPGRHALVAWSEAA